MPRFILAAALIVSVLLGGCGRDEDEPEVVPLDESNALEQVGTIEIQETDERFIGEIMRVDVTTTPHRIYIADRQMDRVAVVNGETGAIVDFIGRPGEGPGELQDPFQPLAVGDRLIVAHRNSQYSVFDTTGSYRVTHRLPENYAYAGLNAISAAGSGYVLAATDNREIAETHKASPDEAPVARMRADFSIDTRFGTYHELYQEEEHVYRLRSLDVNAVGGDSLVAVGYRLAPDVQLYDLGGDPPERVQTVRLDHPAFQRPETELTQDRALGPDVNEYLAGPSGVENTLLLGDGTIVQNFNNRTPEYYELRQDKSEQEDYAILGHIDTDAQKHLDLPGLILGRDAEDRIYILLNHVPDERVVGIYEVNWP